MMGPLRRLARDTEAGHGLRGRYFCTTAQVATPPPAECTQTVVGPRLVMPRNPHRPSAAFTVAEPMRAPGQTPRAGAPLWISTLAAKPAPGIRPLVPWTRSSPVPTTSWARLIVTVSAAPGGGAGAAFTV